MIKLKDLLLGKIVENYNDSMTDDEKYDNAIAYFSIGQDDDENIHKNYCWIWNGSSIIAKKGGAHGVNFSHEVADRNFKGWYDVEKNAISVAFPSHELRKLGDKRPTEDDIPQRVYDALIRKFGKNKPNFLVVEDKRNRPMEGVHEVVVGSISVDGEMRSSETRKNHTECGIQRGNVGDTIHSQKLYIGRATDQSTTMKMSLEWKTT